MGSDGTYGSRDVIPAPRGRSFSDQAEKALSQRGLHPALNPYDRQTTCDAEDPEVVVTDETGSMGKVPKIFFDKYSLFNGQTVGLGLLTDPKFSICAVGDIEFGQEVAPVQIGDFVPFLDLEEAFKRIFLEGNGGGNHTESYPYIMYYFAYLCDLPNAKTPIFVLTCDEGFLSTLSKRQLDKLFGTRQRQHETTTMRQVFSDLEAKFKGNVFLIRRQYGLQGREDGIMNQWVQLMGRGRIAMLHSSEDGDKSAMDVLIGINALVSGRMTLDEYCRSMTDAREEPQTAERIAHVRESLAPVAEFCASRLLPDDERVTAEEMAYVKRTAVATGRSTSAASPPRRRRRSNKDATQSSPAENPPTPVNAPTDGSSTTPAPVTPSPTGGAKKGKKSWKL